MKNDLMPIRFIYLLSALFLFEFVYGEQNESLIIRKGQSVLLQKWSYNYLATSTCADDYLIPQKTAYELQAFVTHKPACILLSTPSGPIACVGQFGPWGACSNLCGSGLQSQIYSIVSPPLNGGSNCSHPHGHVQTRPCTDNSCCTPVCGSAHGSTLISAPTTNLCSVGVASPVSGSGPWTWTCQNCSSNVSCSADLQPHPLTSYPPDYGGCKTGTIVRFDGLTNWSCGSALGCDFGVQRTFDTTTGIENWISNSSCRTPRRVTNLFIWNAGLGRWVFSRRISETGGRSRYCVQAC